MILKKEEQETVGLRFYSLSSFLLLFSFSLPLIVSGQEKETLSELLSDILRDTDGFESIGVSFFYKQTDVIAKTKSDNGKDWLLSFNKKWWEEINNSKEFIYTIVHETGHIITLLSTEIDYDQFIAYQDGDNFKRYQTEEGLSKEQSYLNLFVQEFWKGMLLYEWDMAKNKKEKQEFQKKFRPFFISELASESPEEDIAESWTEFVFSKEKPSGEGLLEKKISFFYRFPELIEFKKRLMDSLSQLAKKES